jgi:acyl-CoA synthetase (NDP forming)
MTAYLDQPAKAILTGKNIQNNLEKIMRDRTSAIPPSQLASLFAPRHIVLVGATDKSFWSQIIYSNFAPSGYAGQVFLVNKRAAPAHGQVAYATCRDLPATPDLAYIYVPIEGVEDALEDAAAAGVKAAIILTSGFAEAGEEGARLQDNLLAAARRHGMVIFGPNSLGFLNLAENIPVSPMRVMQPVLPPSVGLVSQSGATAIDLYDFAQQENIGLSFIAATGNEAQVDISTVISYLVDAPHTKAIAVFAETIRDPAAFIAAAERARAARKPIVILKVGKSALSAQVAQAHTGSLVGDDRAFDAACKRHGVVRVTSCEDLILTAGLLAAVGPLKRPGIGITSISGGACTLIADRAEEAGVSLPALAPATVAALREIMPGYGSTLNPLDITGAAVRDATLFRTTLTAIARDPQIGLVGVCMTPPNGVRQSSPAGLTEIGNGAREVDVPVVVISTHLKNLNDFSRDSIAEHRLPFVIGGLDHAVRAFGHAAWWSAQLSRPAAAPYETVPSGAHPVTERETLGYLAGFGVPVIPARLVTNADEAAAAAFDGPVVLKIASPDIAHKTEVGGVRLNISGADAVAAAFQEIMRNANTAAPNARLDGVIISPMRTQGIELFVGITWDPSWGPVVALGLGGIWVEALADTALALLPVKQDEVVEMLQSLRASRVLNGFRGAPPVNFCAVADVIVKIGEAALALGPSLAALEINPLLVNGDQVEALDGLAVWQDAETS